MVRSSLIAFINHRNCRGEGPLVSVRIHGSQSRTGSERWERGETEGRKSKPSGLSRMNIYCLIFNLSLPWLVFPRRLKRKLRLIITRASYSPQCKHRMQDIDLRHSCEYWNWYIPTSGGRVSWCLVAPSYTWSIHVLAQIATSPEQWP